MMSGGYIALSIFLTLACLALIVAILMQKKRQAGFSGTIAGGGGDKTYWDKNKSKSFEGRLEKYTKILGAVFMITSLIIGFFV
ncbi:MAG: preprotein translocase subunit SecG [Defluviitaleaceae bacterium]|nr:preprotein translocase subunit SecG [Defluviitaleaceae bacterium]